MTLSGLMIGIFLLLQNNSISHLIMHHENYFHIESKNYVKLMSRENINEKE